ncbi:DUF2490 domain-containing protein [Mucilaginibacter terrenus]|uniref:DUF2490 domain-containing protein n=1 Tax=Mucilaginibacter terrenus TaxID=2482727 RepID=A0A3E2NY20_9SPHI|nr:DUF2490 domain-containing protein [Mucilaginibacter terrenus]RFZ85914.1 DUF2490 domain-containing protein [Mucilaginibacter terrenus]
MNKKVIRLLLLITILSPVKLLAQDNQFTGWGAIFHTQKFSDKWGMSFDGQFRSADQYDYLRNILLRPAVNYYFSSNKIGALGYAYITANGRSGNVKTFRPESRIFEQFIINQKLGKGAMLQHRFRLEQRFLGNTSVSGVDRNDSFFSQRLRYFARAVVPFKSTPTFTEGPFFALQNEIFFNVQNKNKVNTHFFDQNRAYGAFGYRFSKKFDTEVGYLNQYTKAATSYTLNHVIQLAFYTRF